MNNSSISTNKFLNIDGNIDIKALQDIINRLNDKINGNIFSDFDGKILSISFTSSVVDRLLGHGLNFKPNFAIITYQDPSDTVITLNYPDFTNKDISITANKAVEAKILIGRLDE